MATHRRFRVKRRESDAAVVAKQLAHIVAKQLGAEAQVVVRVRADGTAAVIPLCIPRMALMLSLRLCAGRVDSALSASGVDGVGSVHVA